MFNSLLAACAGKARWGYNVSAEHVRNAEALLADMRAAGHTPDDVTHLNMATLYARAGMCAAAAACGLALRRQGHPGVRAIPAACANTAKHAHRVQAGGNTGGGGGVGGYGGAGGRARVQRTRGGVQAARPP